MMENYRRLSSSAASITSSGDGGSSSSSQRRRPRFLRRGGGGSNSNKSKSKSKSSSSSRTNRRNPSQQQQALDLSPHQDVHPSRPSRTPIGTASLSSLYHNTNNTNHRVPRSDTKKKPSFSSSSQHNTRGAPNRYPPKAMYQQQQQMQHVVQHDHINNTSTHPSSIGGGSGSVHSRSSNVSYGSRTQHGHHRQHQPRPLYRPPSSSAAAGMLMSSSSNHSYHSRSTASVSAASTTHTNPLPHHARALSETGSVLSVTPTLGTIGSNLSQHSYNSNTRSHQAAQSQSQSHPASSTAHHHRALSNQSVSSSSSHHRQHRRNGSGHHRRGGNGSTGVSTSSSHHHRQQNGSGRSSGADRSHEEHRDPFAETTAIRSSSTHSASHPSSSHRHRHHHHRRHSSASASSLLRPPTSSTNTHRPTPNNRNPSRRPVSPGPAATSYAASYEQHQYYTNADEGGGGMLIYPTPVKHPQPRRDSSSSSLGRGGDAKSRVSTVNSNSNSTVGAITPKKQQKSKAHVSINKHFLKSTKKVIDGLEKSADAAYPGDKRVIALTNACAEFDHLDDSRHNMELQLGAAAALCRVLAIVLNTADDLEETEEDDEHEAFEGTTADLNISAISYSSANTTTTNATHPTLHYTDDALRMIATALEMVFRGQGSFVQTAYDKCGGTTQYEALTNHRRPSGLLALVLRLLQRAEGLHCGTRMKRHNADVSLLHATKVLLYLSRVPELRHHLAQQPTLLDALSRVGRDMNKSSTATAAVIATNLTTDHYITKINNKNAEEARVTRIRIIANLVNEEANKPLLLIHSVGGSSTIPNSRKTNRDDSNDDDEARNTHASSGLLDALLRISHLDPNHRAREYASVALMDLASSPQNQITMTKNQQLLSTLVTMVLIEPSSATSPGDASVRSSGATSTTTNGVGIIRESAITALQNLAFTKENRIRLVSFKNGIVLEALLKAVNGNMTASTSNNLNLLPTGNDNKSRRRAAGALTNLACDETAELMGRHPRLLQTLAMVSTKDTSPEVQTRSAMALTKLAASLTIHMDDTNTSSREVDDNGNTSASIHSKKENKNRDNSASSHSSRSQSTKSLRKRQISSGSSSSNNNNNDKAVIAPTHGVTYGVFSTLLDALVVASLSPVSNSVSAVLRVKARDPENRYKMAHHPGVLDTLGDMCLYRNHLKEPLNEGNSDAIKNNGTSVYTVNAIKDCDNATRALMHLTNESRNHISMCTSAVLDALVKGASITDEEIANYQRRYGSVGTGGGVGSGDKHNNNSRLVLKDVRDCALRALERLATEFTNRYKMAHHPGLLVTVAQATEREAKLDAKATQQQCTLIQGRDEEHKAVVGNNSGGSGRSNTSASSRVVSARSRCRSNNGDIPNQASSSVSGTVTSTQSKHPQQRQQVYLAKPLLMSLLVAM